MSGICEDRVVVVTGAGRGIGRAYALEFARQGARVVVNDLGGGRDGTGSSTGPAADVVDEIAALGGRAVANTDDVSDWDGAQRLVHAAVDTFGGLDVLVNNAGILRDRMVVNMSEEDWDAVIRVHLRGTFATTRHAAAYWRQRSKDGHPVDARIINTSSSSGIFGNAGQTNYGAAKAGIAAFTIIAATELARYGVTVNAIYPVALSRLTEDVISTVDETRTAALAPERNAPLVAWLGSPEASTVTGRVFGVYGNEITVAEGWHAGPRISQEQAWDPAELGKVIPDLVAKAAPNANTHGDLPTAGA